MRKVSLESRETVEAELVPYSEGSMCIVDMRDDVAPPGSRTASRQKGQPRDPGDPTGSVEMIDDGGAVQGETGAMRRAEVGSRTGPYYRRSRRTIPSGCGGDEGKGPARGDLTKAVPGTVRRNGAPCRNNFRG
jgi:hypothetical protein